MDKTGLSCCQGRVSILSQNYAEICIIGKRILKNSNKINNLLDIFWWEGFFLFGYPLYYKSAEFQ